MSLYPLVSKLSKDMFGGELASRRNHDTSLVAKAHFVCRTTDKPQSVKYFVRRK